jgi:hypothetical protein
MARDFLCGFKVHLEDHPNSWKAETNREFGIPTMDPQRKKKKRGKIKSGKLYP